MNDVNFNFNQSSIRGEGNIFAKNVIINKTTESAEFPTTETEKELVRLIFEHTKSEEERQEIIKSLKSIKTEGLTEEVKIVETNRIKSFLTKMGGKAVEIGFTEALKLYIKESPAFDYLQEKLF